MGLIKLAANSQQLLHLLYYLLFYFTEEHFGRLSHWLSLEIHIEHKYHQFEVQLGHLAVVPCKDILEFFQQ